MSREPTKPKKTSKKADHIRAFAYYLCSLGFKVEPELRFHPTRRWRFDLAIPDLKIAIEVEGGVWTQGRHTRGSGYIGDLEKYNEAAILGWLVLRFTTDQVREASVALSTVERAAQARRLKPVG